MLFHESITRLAYIVSSSITISRRVTNIRSWHRSSYAYGFERVQSNISLRIWSNNNDLRTIIPLLSPGNIPHLLNSRRIILIVDSVARTMDRRCFYRTSSKDDHGDNQKPLEKSPHHGPEIEEDEHHHEHGIFSAHSHSRDNKGIAQALERETDRGSRITIIGLVANVGLTTSKGVAGWYMNSASLLADAGHSGSDLLGDFVTLFCWKLSRKSPTEKYPYGFAKFETIGTTTVSLLLIGAALGIGYHSYSLLISHIAETASVLPPGPSQDVLQEITQKVQDATMNVSNIGPSNGDSDLTLDPNAAWLAGISIVVKEWLYRITKKVADEEQSSVLLANALHHRSDAYSSLVTVVAIVGTAAFPAVPLDPIGGLLVSFVILRQGLLLLVDAIRELTDAGVSRKMLKSLMRTLKPLFEQSSPTAEKGLLNISDIRARRSGAVMFVDVIANVRKNLGIQEALEIEKSICTTLTDSWREIYEVRVKFEFQDDEKDFSF